MAFDQETLSRLKIAISKGMDPNDAFQAAQLYQVKKGAVTPVQAPQQQPTKKPFRLSDLLPAAGGILGGIAGSFGGPAGSIAGGGAGSAIGEAIRQKVQHESLNPGKIAAEGGIGVIGGIGGELIGAGTRVASNLLGDIGSKTLIDTTANTATKTAASAGSKALDKSILGQLANSAGKAVVNPKVPATPFAAEEEANIIQGLRSLLKGGAAQAQREQIPDVFRNISTQIEDKLANNTEKIGASKLKTIINTALDSNINFDPAIKGYASARDKFLAQLTKGAKSKLGASDIYAFKKNLGDQLTRAFTKVDSGLPLTAQEETGLAIWSVLDKAITDLAPDVKNLTLQQSILYKAAPGLQDAAKKSLKIAGIDVPGATRAGQAALDRTARILNIATKPVNKAGQVTTDSVGQLLSQLGIRSGLNNAGDSIDTSMLTSPLPQDFNAQQDMPTGQSTPTSGLTKEDLAKVLLADLAANKGKNIGTLTAIGKLLLPDETKTKTPTSAQLKDITNAQSGLNAISTMENELVNNRGVLLKAKVPGSPGARTFVTARNEAQDVLSRLRTGAAINAQEEAFYRNQLPNAFDDPVTIQYKLNIFRNLFSSIANQDGNANQNNGAVQSSPLDALLNFTQ